MTIEEWLQYMLELAEAQLGAQDWAELCRNLGAIAPQLDLVSSHYDLVPIIVQIQKMLSRYPVLQRAMAAMPRIGSAPSGQVIQKLRILLLPMASPPEAQSQSRPSEPARSKHSKDVSFSEKGASEPGKLKGRGKPA